MPGQILVQPLAWRKADGQRSCLGLAPLCFLLLAASVPVIVDAACVLYGGQMVACHGGSWDAVMAQTEY